MAIKQVGITVCQNIKNYQCATTDLVADYPDISDCGFGSKMVVIDETTHTVDHYLYFDGTTWNTYA